MMRLLPMLLAPVAIILCAASPEARDAQKLSVSGWVENGWLGSPPIKVKVKLDTGAKTSSIHAAQYQRYEKGGAGWVRFTLTNNDGAELKIDQPVVRTVTIVRAGVEKKDRPVIRLKVCVAGVTREEEFTMADRSELTYPVLIGRNFLADNLLVDSARTFLASGKCGAN